MSTATVNISFEKKLLSDIDHIAQKECRSRSELLREAARLYLERKKRWEQIFSYGRSRAKKNRLTQADVTKQIQAYRKKKSTRS